MGKQPCPRLPCKIALIGAGSVVFAQRLLEDVISTPSLKEAYVSLTDIDRERLDLVGRLANRLVADTGSGNTIVTTTDRTEALDEADYVITSIRVGDDVAIDQLIPLKYGVDQVIGDTVGPGGVFKALRTAPVLLDICEDMEELCPEAWLLQYTNPMAICCWCIAEASSINTVGLCHSVQGTTRQLADYIGAPPDSVSAWVAGINHMAWFLRFERDGEDAYPALWQALEDPDTYAKDTVRFEVMRHLGYFVSESTRHMSEYVPYFRTKPEVMERFGLRPADPELAGYEEKSDRHFTQIRRDVEGPGPLGARRSIEYASRIMDALEGGQPTVINGNVPNEALITNLGDGACVEVPCLVDRLGIHPMSVGDLPPQLAALNRSNMAVQEVVDGSKEAVKHAVMLDPLTAASATLDRADAMFEEMWSAHGDQLALYL